MYITAKMQKKKRGNYLQRKSLPLLPLYNFPLSESQESPLLLNSTLVPCPLFLGGVEQPRRSQAASGSYLIRYDKDSRVCKNRTEPPEPAEHQFCAVLLCEALVT